MTQNIRNESIIVDTASKSISSQLTHGQQRYALTVVNTSTNGAIITLSWQTQAQTYAGIVLYPTGTHSESVDSAFLPLNTEIYAISSVAGGQIALHERTLVG